MGFNAVHPECWPSIFWNAELSLLLAVYVGDFKLAGPETNHAKGWELVGKHIDMDTPEDVGRYLGCDHVVSPNVKLSVENHPFAHVFDHKLNDPASKPAAPVRRRRNIGHTFRNMEHSSITMSNPVGVSKSGLRAPPDCLNQVICDILNTFHARDPMPRMRGVPHMFGTMSKWTGSKDCLFGGHGRPTSSTSAYPIQR